MTDMDVTRLTNRELHWYYDGLMTNMANGDFAGGNTAETLRLITAEIRRREA